MWLDQLCINQTNIAERNAQVQIMGDIYYRAARTAIWLGEAEADNDAAFDLLSEFSTTQICKIYDSARDFEEAQKSSDRQRKIKPVVFEEEPEWRIIQWVSAARHSLRELEPTDSRVEALSSIKQVDHWVQLQREDSTQERAWTAFGRLFLRPWWRRFWCVQEVAMSTQLTFHCGGRYATWVDLFMLFSFVESQSTSTDSLLDGQVVGLLRRDYRGKKYQTHPVRPDSLQMFRQMTFEGKDDLHTLIAMTQDFMASDPRDKVYALLGLIGGQYGIKVDYTMTLAAVFTQAVKAIICVDQQWCFDLLSSNTYYLDMPRWVPNLCDHSVLYSVDEGWQAGGAGVPQAEFLENDTIMRLTGLKVGGLVDGLRERCDDEDDTDAVADWAGCVVDRCHQRGTHPRKYVEDFFSTIIAGEGRVERMMKQMEKEFGNREQWNLEHLQQIEPDSGEPDLHQFIVSLASIVLIEYRFGAPKVRLPAAFFLSPYDFMGVLPGQSRPEDLIFVPLAAKMPLIVRQTDKDGQFIVIGECYVHEIMHGELLDENRSPCKCETVEIDLV